MCAGTFPHPPSPAHIGCTSHTSISGMSESTLDASLKWYLNHTFWDDLDVPPYDFAGIEQYTWEGDADVLSFTLLFTLWTFKNQYVSNFELGNWRPQVGIMWGTSWSQSTIVNQSTSVVGRLY